MAFRFAQKKNFLTALMVMAFGAALAQGQELGQDFCGQWQDLPIRSRGRVKPLYVHARQSIKFLIGSTRLQGVAALDIYCALSLPDLPAPSFKASIQHLKLRKLLELEEGQKQIDYSQLLGHERTLQLALRREGENPSSYQKALERVLGQIALYRSIQEGRNWMVFVQGDWVPLNTLWIRSDFQLESLLQQSRADYVAQHGERHLVELFYAKSSIHLLAMVLILLSIALLVLIKNPLLGLMGAGTCVLVQVVAIVLRIYISGRAPITNMYETVLFSGFAGLMIALVVGHLRREKIYVLAGLAYNFLCTLMINFAHGMVSGDISPLVPVLRDNFWLSTHVTTVILSYAAFALAWVLANMVLIKGALVGHSSKELRYQADLIYTSLKVGTVLLSLGIILGGVWADYSWGRFWGWDPKETWSAIALCIYLAILHGRYTHWMKDAIFIPAVAMAFMGIMMAWFGVNYILASGLHSYGFSEGGAIFLGSFFVVQVIILIATRWRKRYT